MEHAVGARTDIGREREGNEDNHCTFRRSDGVHILIVCDGMGGHEGGEIASRVACETLKAELEAAEGLNPPLHLRDALYKANAAVLAAATPAGGRDMGTTAVVAWVDGLRLWYAWVGDSRLFHLRDGVRIGGTKDHTRVQVMVDLGMLTEEEAQGHPEGHILMQALGGGPAAQQSFEPGITEESVDLRQGDVLILCTDGLHDLVPEAGLIVASSGRTPGEATEALVQSALEAGGYDNITVVLMIVDAPSSPVLSVELEQQLRAKLKRNPLVAPPRYPGDGPALQPILVGLFFGTLAGLALGWWIHNHI